MFWVDMLLLMTVISAVGLTVLLTVASMSQGQNRSEPHFKPPVGATCVVYCDLLINCRHWTLSSTISVLTQCWSRKQCSKYPPPASRDRCLLWWQHHLTWPVLYSGWL